MHYSLAVFTDGEASVDELLCRYSVDSNALPREYLAFDDATSYLNEKFATGTAPCIKIGGTYYDPYSKEAKDCYDEDRKLKDGYVIEDVPLNKLYKDIKELAEKHFDFKWNDEEKAYGEWVNMDAKYDWYQEGGRFAGRLYSKLKQNYVDTAEMKDIDFDKMETDIKEEERANYDEMSSTYNRLTEAERKTGLGRHLKKFLEKYPTKESYVDGACIAFITYSVLTPDGEWHEREYELIKDENKALEIRAEEEKRWRSYFEEVLKEAKEKNWQVTIIDYHA